MNETKSCDAAYEKVVAASAQSATAIAEARRPSFPR